MESPACQSKLPDEARFCNVCGERLELECPQCNKVNPLGSRFCLACGKELAEKLPSDTTELVADAERKQVTALFSDLTGYTALTERVDPDEV